MLRPAAGAQTLDNPSTRPRGREAAGPLSGTIGRVYQALLTRKYLGSKVMPLLSAMAVALCTAMVLIVWSVMGGFLVSLLAQGRGMIGDVCIAYPVAGIPYYEELLGDLRADPMVGSATGVIESLALLGLDNGEQRAVTLVGVDMDEYAAVTDFKDRLWWRPLETPLPRDTKHADPRLSADAQEALRETFENGERLSEINPESEKREPAMVLGIEVTRYNSRRAAGYFEPGFGVWVPNERYTLGVLPLSRKGVAIQVEYRSFPVANEFHTGMYEVDANWVIIPLAEAQRMLKMDSAKRADPDFVPGGIVIDDDGNERPAEPRIVGNEPARVTNVLVRAKDGVDPNALEARVETIYEAFAEKHAKDHPDVPLVRAWRDRMVYQWDKKPGLDVFIAAVRKETGLVLGLLVFISMTAAFLVCAIFWAMVSEKTRDIGVLRAIGASRAGVAWLFLRYGLTIGVVGSIAGGILAYTIVTNINPIHEWMGRTLGLTIWDPSVYYFTEIPNKVEPMKAVIVLAGGIVFSVFGALLPAIRAAWMDPVKALRFE